ncbi:MAG TPA: toll/interleukin-1 receptor domain-containing protein [Xanthobacteraceae bacterium]|nr:toll/interleukin-1 receptor domain-containing protein [Xanthobacteraceae bacterium]
MSVESAKPVIFISYSHKDEPEHPRGDEIQWLSFVRMYLQPAVKGGIFDQWDDRQMSGGTDWDPEIEQKLRECDIFILLVSVSSMASDYVVDKEIAIIRERQANGDDVHFYPLLLTPTPKAGLQKVKDKNLRPRDAKPFSRYSAHDRAEHMSEAANEIAEIAERIAKQKSASQRTVAQSPAQPSASSVRFPLRPYHRPARDRVRAPRRPRRRIEAPR